MSRLPIRVNWAGVASLVLAGIVSGSAFAAAPDKAAAPLTDEQINQVLARPVIVDFNATPLADVVQCFEVLLGIPFHLDRKALDDASVPPDSPITQAFRGVSARTALTLTLQSLDLKWCPYDAQMILVTTGERRDEVALTRVYDVHDLIAGKDEKGPDTDEFDSLIELIQTTIQPQTWNDTAGGSGTIRGYRAQGIKAIAVRQTWEVQQAVKNLLSELRAIRPARGEAAPAEKRPPSSLPEAIRPPRKTSSMTPGEEKVMAALDRRISFDFHETPLREVAQLLGRQLAVPVVLDRRAAAEEITATARCRDERGEAVLDLLARQYDLDWSIQNEGIFLAMEDVAPRFTRTYDVRDLTARRTKDGKIVYHAEALVDAITSSVAPGHWEKGDEEAISASPDAAGLVVSQTW